MATNVHSDNIVMADPVYIKNNEVRNKLGSNNNNSYELCVAVEKTIPNKLKGCQFVKGLWKIYAADLTSRVKLLTHGISLRGLHVQPLEKNPFLSDGQTRLSEKIVFRDLDMKVPNSSIRKFLLDFPHAILQSDIIYGKIQDNNERSTKYLSGERYIYATDEIFPPLPHKAVIDGQHCTIWHRSQSAICLRCRGQGHKTNDTEKCEAYCNSDNIYAFQSGKDVLSNFHYMDLKMDGITFSSSEQAYQYKKMMHFKKSDIADKIRHARTPRIAKSLAILTDAEAIEWNEHKANIMWTVLCAKAVCNISFVEKLASTNGKYIVEASRDDNYWGSGLSISLSETTKPDYFPEGSNMLGNLLMHLRTEVVAYHYTDQNNIEKSQTKPENEQYTAPPSVENNDNSQQNVVPTGVGTNSATTSQTALSSGAELCGIKDDTQGKASGALTLDLVQQTVDTRNTMDSQQNDNKTSTSVSDDSIQMPIVNQPVHANRVSDSAEPMEVTTGDDVTKPKHEADVPSQQLLNIPLHTMDGPSIGAEVIESELKLNTKTTENKTDSALSSSKDVVFAPHVSKKEAKQRRHVLPLSQKERDSRHNSPIRNPIMNQFISTLQLKYVPTTNSDVTTKSEVGGEKSMSSSDAVT